jgi:hypothetical protein
MTLVLVEVPDEEAMELLRQHPRLQIVKLMPPLAPRRKPSIASLVGTLSDETAERMRAETTQMRGEWEREY